jgi:hypothetical protein
MDAQELGTTLRQATRSLFRLEMEPAYDVPTDGNDFQRYLAGEPGPDMERKQRWLDFLHDQRAQGIYRYRVRVLRTPLSQYDRYACAWGYRYNVQAGDDTRILDLTVQPLPVDLWRWHDFWLVDDERAIRMDYNRQGNFLGAEIIDPDRVDDYRHIRDTAWEAAEPFESWWNRHRASREVS